MDLKILGGICFMEIVGTVGTAMGCSITAGASVVGTSLLTIYTIFWAKEKLQKKICPECRCEIQRSNRICPECGHLFQKGISEEKLTDLIEKEKENDMSSAQIDKAFEKVETISMENVDSYEAELDKIFSGENI